jgi:hypothetical protein
VSCDGKEFTFCPSESSCPSSRISDSGRFLEQISRSFLADHSELQRRVLMEAFRALETASESGTMHDLIIKWADVRREAKTLSGQGWKL